MKQSQSPAWEAIETTSRDELSALQLERLKQTLKLAYDKVPHYRKAFQSSGVDPESLKDLDSLSRFPFTLKQDLRQNYPFGMFAVPCEEVMRIHASSGTTGQPTVVGYTRKDIDTWAHVMARTIWACGGRPGDLAHVAYGYGLFTGGLGAHYGAEKLGCTVIPVSGGLTERQVRLIHDFRPALIMITPSYLLALAEEFDRQGLNTRESSLRIGICGAEPWTVSMRREIEERLKMQCLDIYGLSEVIGPGVSSECIEEKDGLYLWEDHFYPEIIDPQTGEVLPDGEAGELVITSLTKEASPIIRYRTRDLTRLLPGKNRTMRRMQKVTGRSDDMMIVRGVNVFPSQIEEIILEDTRLSPNYQIELSRDGVLDEMKVLSEPRDEEPSAEVLEDIVSNLVSHIKNRIGVTAKVKLVAKGVIERSAGKARRIVDKRKKN